ncbi:MAG TPA: hypothetical protein IAA59_01965 [Candidatus Faecaligallichristensenella faecipullorum]|nr:hypothetical protein [Candidatus Faecaligallichristensenella faecipullorum]
MCTYLIGIDLGTQGTKTCLYTQEGHLVNSAFEASNLIMPGPGRVEQDPDELYSSVMRTISEVMEKNGKKRHSPGKRGGRGHGRPNGRHHGHRPAVSGRNPL